MPQSPVPDQSTTPDSEFGANEWLVEEKYEQYQKDPGSVGPEWSAFFQERGGEGRSTRQNNTPAASSGAAGVLF